MAPLCFNTKISIIIFFQQCSDKTVFATFKLDFPSSDTVFVKHLWYIQYFSAKKKYSKSLWKTIVKHLSNCSASNKWYSQIRRKTLIIKKFCAEQSYWYRVRVKCNNEKYRVMNWKEQRLEYWWWWKPQTQYNLPYTYVRVCVFVYHMNKINSSHL